MKPYIVCGWYTADYAHWLDTLIPSLNRIGAPHDFVEVKKPTNEWEKTTLLKAAQVKAAMQRHPDKTIIFLDVDCEVLSSLEELLDVSGDIACFMETKANVKRCVLDVWSGTLVINRTQKTKELIDLWVAESRVADRYAVDQTTLASAMGKIPGLTVTFLDRKWCARPWDAVRDAVIVHDSASIETKTPLWKQKWHRRLHRWGLAA